MCRSSGKGACCRSTIAATAIVTRSRNAYLVCGGPPPLPTLCARSSRPGCRRASSGSLEEFAEERCRCIRDTDDLVRCLTIELEIELGPGLAVIPVGKLSKLTPPQRPLRERRASDGDAHTRRLPGDAGLLRNRDGGRDDAAGDQALSAVVLASEHEDHVAICDVLAAIHCLLRGECERLRPRLEHLGFDRERHAPPLPPQMSAIVEPAACLR